MADDAQTAGSRAAVDYDALTDRLRGRVDLFGKSIAGIATLGTGAVGLTTVSDLAPRGGLSWIFSLAAIGSLLVAAWGAVRIAAALIQVNRPVVLEPDDKLLELEGAEKLDVERIYADSAQRYGQSSLIGLQDRESALRLASVAATDSDERARRTALADEAAAEIQHALSRARWALVRRRSSEAASGNTAKQSYLMVAAGLLAFALLSDVATANQSDNIAMAQACGEAREAGALDGDLAHTQCFVPEPAGDQETNEPAPATSKGPALAQIAGQLVDVLQECNGLAEADSDGQPAGGLDSTDCESVKDALKEVLQSVQAAEPSA